MFGAISMLSSITTSIFNPEAYLDLFLAANMIDLRINIVVVVGFIHCDLKHEYFYVDYSIE